MNQYYKITNGIDWHKQGEGGARRSEHYADDIDMIRIMEKNG